MGGPAGRSGDLSQLSTRKLVILLNPAAAGGRAAQLLPDAQRELETLGLPHRVVETRDMAHASQAAKEVADDETVVARGGEYKYYSSATVALVPRVSGKVVFEQVK